MVSQVRVLFEAPKRNDHSESGRFLFAISRRIQLCNCVSADVTRLLTGSHEPLPVADEGEVRTGKNKEYHERFKRSETTMFLTVTRGHKLKSICLNSSVGRARGC